MSRSGKIPYLLRRTTARSAHLRPPAPIPSGTASTGPHGGRPAKRGRAPARCTSRDACGKPSAPARRRRSAANPPDARARSPSRSARSGSAIIVVCQPARGRSPPRSTAGHRRRVRSSPHRRPTAPAPRARITASVMSPLTMIGSAIASFTSRTARQSAVALVELLSRAAMDGDRLHARALGSRGELRRIPASHRPSRAASSTSPAARSRPPPHRSAARRDRDRASAPIPTARR